MTEPGEKSAAVARSAEDTAARTGAADAADVARVGRTDAAGAGLARARRPRRPTRRREASGKGQGGRRSPEPAKPRSRPPPRGGRPPRAA